MKRSLAAAVIIGVFVSCVVLGLHISGVLLRFETAVTDFVLRRSTTTKTVTEAGQYAFVVIIALGVAWLTWSTPRRARLGWIIAVLMLELVAVAWVCALYRVYFQPLPSVIAAILGFVLAYVCALIAGRSRSRMASSLFTDRLSRKQIARIASGELPLEAAAKIYEATAVVCDIAHKHDLAEELSPEIFAEVSERFIGHATKTFLDAGAYLEAAAGEGVVAIFGFPEMDAKQAEKATREALGVVKSFAALRENGSDEIFKKFDVHVGVSSGTIVVAPLNNKENPIMLTTGEPVELARRFCIANRFYGSRVLIGPRTFELASKTIVARPIDFLSGVDVRERHEIYEPVSLAVEATADEITRRDFFWNGVVLYREKRWAEAYSQFQKARGPKDTEDSPLQLYLRRLEPLALHLTESLDE